MEKPGQHRSSGLEAAAVEAQQSVDNHGQPSGGGHQARTLRKTPSQNPEMDDCSYTQHPLLCTAIKGQTEVLEGDLLTPATDSPTCGTPE